MSNPLITRHTPRWSDKDIETLRRVKAAKKAAETKRVNAARWKHWREVDEPGIRRVDSLLRILLRDSPHISLRWNPVKDVGKKLKNGASYGTLVGILNGGRLWRVLPEGYKRPQDFHPAFWEVLAP